MGTWGLRNLGSVLVDSDLWLGPGVLDYPRAVPAVVPLNDAGASMSWTFSAPKDGTITKVGLYIDAVGGTPPAYNFDIVTILGTGNPSTVLAGTGRTQSTLTPTVTGWVWVTLTSPLTVVAGDRIAIRIWPTATAPDGINYINTYKSGVWGSGNLPRCGTTTTSLTSVSNNFAFGYMAAQYSDGFTVGYPQVNRLGAPNGGDGPDNPSSETFGPTDVSIDELGGLFSLPVAVRCVGLRGGLTYFTPGTATTMNFKLYDTDGVTVLAQSGVVTGNDMSPTSVPEIFHIFWPTPVTLEASYLYRVSCLAVTDGAGTNDFRLGQYTLPDAASRSAFTEGTRWQRTARLAGGAWTEDNTKIPMWAIIADGIHLPTV